VHHADALGIDPADYAGNDLVIANPPFAHAASFLATAVGLVRNGGLVAFLLRATWLAPATRAHVPTPDLLMLRRRPSFKRSARGNSTDSADYAWHLWRVGDPMHGGRFAVLDCEPARKAKAKR
jgi:hypothetical protein